MIHGLMSFRMGTSLLRHLSAAWIGLLALTLTVPTPVAADDVQEDWPQWRGARRDGVSRETGLLLDFSKRKPRTVWQRPLGKGFSSISVVKDRAYTLAAVDDREIVFCLDAQDGNTIWQVPSGSVHRDYQGGDGPRSTPTVDGSLVYTLGAEGDLLCLEADSGSVRWRKNVLREFGAKNLHWGVSMSPLIDGEKLLVNVGGKGASIVAFDKHNGEVIWKALDDVAGYASPIRIDVPGQGGRSVPEYVFFCGKALIGVSPDDGTEHWRYEWITTSDMNIATPIYEPETQTLFVSAARDTGRCSAYRLAGRTGTVQADHVYTNKNMRNHYNGCVRVGQYVYGFDESILTCIRLADGEQMWEDRSVGKGSLIAAQGHLLVLGEKGDLGVVEATPEAYREKGRFKALDSSRAWSPPALSRGRLYVRDLENIACIDLSAE